MGESDFGLIAKVIHCLVLFSEKKMADQFHISVRGNAQTDAVACMWSAMSVNQQYARYLRDGLARVTVELFSLNTDIALPAVVLRGQIGQRDDTDNVVAFALPTTAATYYSAPREMIVDVRSMLSTTWQLQTYGMGDGAVYDANVPWTLVLRVEPFDV